MTKVFVLTIILLLVGVAGISGQDRQGEVLTDYPILKTGVFANRSYPAAPILGNSATGDRRKTFRIMNGVFKTRLDKDGYIERTGAYLTKVEYAGNRLGFRSLNGKTYKVAKAGALAKLRSIPPTTGSGVLSAMCSRIHPSRTSASNSRHFSRLLAFE